MESSQSTRLHSIKKVIFFIEQKWNSKVHYLFLFPQTAYKLELDYHLSITNKNPDAKFCRYTNIQSTFIKNAITKKHNSTRSHYRDNKNQNILMKTLKPKSNWIKFNTHKAQILLSHHHSSNPTVKTNTQKKSQISNQPNKKLQKQFTTPKLSTKIAFIQENPSQLFPPDPQLRDRNEFKFPLLLSLSQRVWEFRVLFFCFCECVGIGIPLFPVFMGF